MTDERLAREIAAAEAAHAEEMRAEEAGEELPPIDPATGTPIPPASGSVTHTTACLSTCEKSTGTTQLAGNFATWAAARKAV
jgi:hypothetical protein